MKDSLEIELISKETYKKMINKKNLPLWASQFVFDAYDAHKIIGVKKNNLFISTFVAPIFKDQDNCIAIKRNYRFIPYMMPFYWREVSSLQKKQLTCKIFDYLFSNYEYTFIPMHPNFTECAAIASLGGFVEMRQTHILKSQPNYPNSIKQRVRNARNKIEVKMCTDLNDFAFDKSIKGSKEEIFLRTKFANCLFKAGNAIALLGVGKDKIEAGIFLAFDNEWCYLLHSWKENDSVNGIIPLLITDAISYVFQNQLSKVFDFEGSVINSIDDFFSSFNADTITYPYIHHAKDESKLFELIKRSINIPGRKI